VETLVEVILTSAGTQATAGMSSIECTKTAAGGLKTPNAAITSRQQCHSNNRGNRSIMGSNISRDASNRDIKSSMYTDNRRVSSNMAINKSSNVIL
jgi:hypothetical protein